MERDLWINVRKSRGTVALDVDIRIPADGITVLRGESGSGKTTLADLVAGRIVLDDGLVRLGGRTLVDVLRGIVLPPHARGIGYVFQTHRLFPHLTVRENIEFARTTGHRSKGAWSGLTVDEAARRFGLTHLLDRRPGTLSGGESQRAALARALYGAEDLLILDEPLSSLDPKLRERLMDEIEAALSGLSIPVLYITHSDRETERLARRVYRMAAGRIVDYVDFGREHPHASEDDIEEDSSDDLRHVASTFARPPSAAVRPNPPFDAYAARSASDSWG